MGARANATIVRARRRQTRRASAPAVVCVASRFNAPITERLVTGALRTLAQHGIPRKRVRVLWVPGAFELPIAAAWAAHHLRPAGIVAVGCVLKGETPQYAAIGTAIAQGLMHVSVQTRTPVGFGVIVADSFAKARARAGGAVGNRGEEAAAAVVDLLNLKHQL